MATRSWVFGAVRKAARALPRVEEGTTYGSPALKVDGAMFVCIAIHRSAEPGTLAVRVGFDARDELIAADPATYYLTPHYVNYPVVLVRASRLSQSALKDLLLMAWRFVSAKPRLAPRRRRRLR